VGPTQAIEVSNVNAGERCRDGDCDLKVPPPKRSRRLPRQRKRSMSKPKRVCAQRLKQSLECLNLRVRLSPRITEVVIVLFTHGHVLPLSPSRAPMHRAASLRLGED